MIHLQNGCAAFDTFVVPFEDGYRCALTTALRNILES